MMNRLLSATALVGVLAGYPALAAAETTPAANADQAVEAAAQSEDTATDEKTDGSEIIVTGSRISRPTLQSPVPITSISGSDLLSRGDLNIGDALNDLPQLRSTFSQANSTRFIGTSGLSILDLRGLGTARTLVLVNGRRHVTALPGDYLVDTNTIPDDLLDRVDIVTGGNSAVYGSDAVAGVVNFVLKRNFTGIKLQGQGGISSRGDRGNYFGSIAAGTNFADGRGNIAVAAEYSRNNSLYFIDRPGQTGAYNGRTQFNLSENTAGEPAAGNGIPDNQLYSGVRNGTIADGGLITAVCSPTQADYLTNQVNNIARCRSSSNATVGFGQRYVFDSAGNLRLSNPSLDFRDITNGGSSNTIGGLGSTLRNTGQLSPLLERYSVNLLSHFDISDAFKPFVEAKYVNIFANQEGQPSFWQGSIPGFFGGGTNLRCNNPFLTTQALTTLQSIGQCANAATSTFNISRFNVDFGGRGELQRRETWRLVGGVEGTFNDDWHYEISAVYGEFTSHNESQNNLRLFDLDGNDDGFLLAVNAVAAPVGFTGTNVATGAAGQSVVCAVNATAAGNVRPDCVPINVFGVGAPSAAALAFVNTLGIRDEKATQLDLVANIGGDLSQLFEFPGGPVKFVVGAEYREETARSVWDPLVASGGTFLNAIQPFTPPKFTVAEGFGEISIPLLKDLPFAKELTLAGAARYSSYNTSAGSTWTYNGNFYYAPASFIRLRGSYGKSVRVPTQSDLFSPASQNFAFVGDPCDIQNINNGTPNRAANCAAAGVPAGFVNTVARTQTLGFLSGGNPTLTPESSDSYTLGFIFEPSKLIPGLSLTVDYYDIVVNNRIETLGLQTILNQCYDSPNLNNPFCASLNPRDPATGLFPNIVGIAGGVNFAKQTTSGIDAELQYSHRFESGKKISLNVLATYIFDRTNFVDPTNPNNPNRQLSELGDPQFEGNITAAFETAHGLKLRYNFQLIGKQTIGTYEAQNSFNGLPPQNADQFPRVYYPAITYHNLRISQSIGTKNEFYFGIDNVFDTLPPFGLVGNGGGDAIFDNIGRVLYAGFKVNLR